MFAYQEIAQARDEQRRAGNYRLADALELVAAEHLRMSDKFCRSIAKSYINSLPNPMGFARLRNSLSLISRVFLYFVVIGVVIGLGFAIVRSTRDAMQRGAANVREPTPTAQNIPAGSTAPEAPTTPTTQAPEPVPEAHDTAPATVVGTEPGMKGGGSEMPAADLAETTLRAEQPPLPAREASASAPAPHPPEETPPKTAEADALVKRGDAFFAAGDLASAQLFYEYAVKAGSGAAALRLGSTFDPEFLASAHIGRVRGDAAMALSWYRRARDLGSDDAEMLLRKLENRR